MKQFKDLVGHTLVNIAGGEGSLEVVFTLSDGRRFELYHRQDCCESVYVESVVGDWADLLGTPLLMAEESEGETPAGFVESEWDSYTWTFYKLATIKGYVDIRWCGTSNGYYSERVDFEEIKQSSAPSQ